MNKRDAQARRERMVNAILHSPERAFIRLIADMHLDGECETHEDCEGGTASCVRFFMSDDDALRTLEELIAGARKLLDNP